MNKLAESEPDDVDFFVGGTPAAPSASVDTERFIAEYKKRPEYQLEAENAVRILAANGINFRDEGMEAAEALLEHWRRCLAELRAADDVAVLSDQNGDGVRDVAELTTEPHS